MKTYVLTFIALLALTGLTFGLSFAHLGPWQVPVAITIALAKGLLVALFFMHLVEMQTSTRLAAIVSVLLAATLIGFAAIDVASRTHIETTESGLPARTP